MKVGSLFAGIGGFDLAAEWCGHRTIWTSEIEPYCVRLLAERFPGVPNLGDITAIDWATIERPDILTGGFPCQDISYAGRGAGLAGKRSGLWYEYARAIRELGPRYVVVENVRALFTRGFDQVLGTLADLGYNAEWGMYGASDVGAPHRRHRVWILAYADTRRRDREDEALRPGRNAAHDGGEGSGLADAIGLAGGSRGADNAEQGARGRDARRSGERPALADADNAGRRQGDEASSDGFPEQPDGDRLRGGEGSAPPDADEPGSSRGIQFLGDDQEGREIAGDGYAPECGDRGAGPGDAERGASESGLRRMDDGLSAGMDRRFDPAEWAQEWEGVPRVIRGARHRVARLRGLGNAIVPECAIPIFRRIAELERGGLIDA